MAEREAEEGLMTFTQEILEEEIEQGEFSAIQCKDNCLR